MITSEHDVSGGGRSGNKRQESGGFIAAPVTTSFIGQICWGNKWRDAAAASWRADLACFCVCMIAASS